MADRHDAPPRREISRRDALWWLLAAPLPFGLLPAALLGQQAKAPTNLRVLGAPAPDSPIARGEYPRTLLTPPMLTALRTRIANDTVFRGHWKTAVAQFEAANGRWSTKPDDQYANAFAGFLTMVRRPTNDLGLTWRSSWQTYRDRVVAATGSWSRDGRHSHEAIATALIYDCLYSDLTAAERSAFEGWVELGYARNGWLSNGVEVWDNGASDDHFAKTLCALVSPQGAKRIAEAHAKTLEVVDANNWMGLGFGLNREWHEGQPSRHGLPLLLFALRNAGGYTDADTIDRFLVHLRDAWQLTRHAIIPHPAVGGAPWPFWTSDKFHTQDPIKGYDRQLNVGAHMAWALAVLPRKVTLDAPGLADQPTLARTEAAYFGNLQRVFDEPHSTNGRRLRDVLDVTRLGYAPSSDQARFWSFPAWLVHGSQEWSHVAEADAGIPQVRRYWPGTLEWTFINSDDFAPHVGSVIRYTHRRYGASQYEEGTKQNGRWHVHRDGPLLIQRGETGHGVNTRKAWWCANGVVGFVDPNLYPVFTFNSFEDSDNGGMRDFRSLNTKDAILAESTADFGSVTAWHADTQVVAITSDLTRSYNSSPVQYGPVENNEPKISAFTREFVVIRRGGDGTNREKVFTYDRITLLDTKFEPRYALCPAGDPTIDGTETPVTPWGPDQDDATFDWYAAGPTHWDYAGATRLIYDNRAEPKAPVPGNGKVCVTWLQPGSVKVRKAGGLNARSTTNARMNGHPFFSPWRGWSGKEEWASFNNLEKRAYVGLYTVTVAPATVTRDTRFLMACEVMAVSDAPGAAQALTCDEQSVAARCGAAAVVFAKESAGHSAGRVDIPSGVTLVVLANLPPGQSRVLTPSGGLTITTPNRTASAEASAAGLKNTYGRLVVGLSGAGTLTFG